MRVLPNVRFSKASPQIFMGAMILSQIIERKIKGYATITSCGDGKHSSPSSKHYPDPKTGLVNAMDFRIRDFDGNMNDISALDNKLSAEIVKEAKEAIGPEFDLIFEMDHLHLEYDPKRL